MFNPLFSISLVLLSLLVIGCLAVLVYFSFFGLNFTDEGFYLNMIANVGEYPGWAISQFDAVISPFYHLFAENIVALRIFSLISSLLLGWGAVVLLFLFHRHSVPLRGWQLTLLSLSFSSSIYFAFPLWLTPSYNSVAFAGSTVFAVGLIMAFRIDSIGQYFRYFATAVVTFGLVLAFAGKITTGVALSAILLVVSLFSHLQRKTLLLALFIALLIWLTFAAFVYGGPLRYFDEVLLTRDILSVSDQRHTFLHQISLILEELILGFPWRALIYVFIAQTFFLSAFSILVSRKHLYDLIKFALLVVVTFISIAGFSILFVPSITAIVFNRYVLLSIWLFSLAFSYVSFKLSNRLFPALRFHKPFQGYFDSHWAADDFWLTLGLLLAPFAYAFGTDIGLWEHVYELSFVYVLAFLNLYLKNPPSFQEKSKDSLLLGFVAASVLFVSIPSVAHAVQRPHLQQSPLWLNNAQVSIHQGKAQLKVSSSVAAYLTKFQEAAFSAGFTQGTALLDFGAWKPTLAYVLSGRAIVSPWILAGSDSTNRALQSRLENTSCQDLSSAWIITQPDSTRMPPLSLLEAHGIDLANSTMYELVLSIDTPSLDQGFTPPGNQRLYKPLLSQQVERVCYSRRSSGT